MYEFIRNKALPEALKRMDITLTSPGIMDILSMQLSEYMLLRNVHNGEFGTSMEELQLNQNFSSEDKYEFEQYLDHLIRQQFIRKGKKVDKHPFMNFVGRLWSKFVGDEAGEREMYTPGGGGGVRG
ncbi:MAG TPA: hypothetical protein VHO68_00985 [Bacteroidales bacterium]|nr:hypothetical protein [Bacteroidales bacterium]